MRMMEWSCVVGDFGELFLIVHCRMQQMILLSNDRENLEKWEG